MLCHEYIPILFSSLYKMSYNRKFRTYLGPTSTELIYSQDMPK